MPNNDQPLDHSRGGHNPRPSKSTPRDQLGPMPTSGSGKKEGQTVKKKIGEKSREE